MNVTDIPFNAFLGIERTPADLPFLLKLGQSPTHLNHVGTVHAAVQLALAEASSGEWLVRSLPHLVDEAIAVVRHVEAKFKAPMLGEIRSRAVTSLDEVRRSAEPLAAKGRTLIPVTIEIVDGGGNVGLVATFTWYCQKQKEGEGVKRP
jgi:acyl-coenzyme A thioesterase PaaI-like protein